MSVKLIGDPHLGRKFETGVPLHRRGEREVLQMALFQRELNTLDVDKVVVMGDLFDHPHVGYGVVLRTFQALQQTFNEVIVMTGNHDEPRKRDVVCAIDILEEMCSSLSHVAFVRHTPQQIDGIAVFPWNWTQTATEQVLDFVPDGDLTMIVGHWDLIDYGGDTSHIAPTLALRERVSATAPIFTGHYHVPGGYEVDGVEITCTGSMEPYTHGEDPEGVRYITLTLEELETCGQDLTDMCVRVLLKEGEELPLDLDCLALTGKRVKETSTQLEEIDVENFSWKDILTDALADVPPHVKDFIDDKLKEYEDE